MSSLENSLFDHLKARGLWTAQSLLGDDAAILPYAAENLVVSADLLTEGVDFLLAEAVPERVGRKALAVNLSDLAAMAAVPEGFTVSLAIPQNWPVGVTPAFAYENLTPLEYLKRFYDGLLSLADEFQIPLVGGDTNTFSGPLTIAVSIFGHIEGTVGGTGEGTVGGAGAEIGGLNRFLKAANSLARYHAPGTPWLRSSACPGDAVLLTGPVGGSIFERQFTFTPRVREALYLRKNRTIHAAMDISDGLTLDLSRLAAQSGVGIALDLARIPIHPDAYRYEESALNLEPVQIYDSALSHALSDGEDFELILTAPESEARIIADDPKYRELFGRSPVIIGKVIAGSGLQTTEGRALTPCGFEHRQEQSVF